MDSKLLLKLKLNKEKKNLLKIKTEYNEYNIYYTEEMEDILVRVLELMSVEEQEIQKLTEVTKLDTLVELVEKGFTIRIDEIKNDRLQFIAFKGGASTTFAVSKESGISSLLIKAEDFAEEFLEESKNTVSL